MRGNANELRDVGKNPGESSLFYLTVPTTVEAGYPEKRWRDWKNSVLVRCPVCSCQSMKTWGKKLLSRLVVPRTASGLQGE